MKTNRRRSIFSSLALASLVAVTLSLTSAPVQAVDYEDGCYPPLTQACEVKETVAAETSRVRITSQKPLGDPVEPTDENLSKLILGSSSDGTSNTKPVQLSDSVIVGGAIRAIDLVATLNLKTLNGTISVAPNKTLRISAIGFAPGRAGGFVQVFLSVSDRVGGVNLGRFTALGTGKVYLPTITLEAGAKATFILTEKYPKSQYLPLVKGKFMYNGDSFVFKNYGVDENDAIIIARSTVTATA